MKYIVLHNDKFIVHLNKISCKFPKYFIQLTNGKTTIASFDMKKDRLDKWYIVQPAPVWAIDLLPQLLTFMSEEVAEVSITNSKYASLISRYV